MEILVVIIVILVMGYCYRRAHLNRTEDSCISSNMTQSQDNFDINNDCLDEISENENMIRVFHDNTPIKVIGVGGGGANSIGKIIENPLKGVEYCIVNNFYVWIYDNLQDYVTFIELTPDLSSFSDATFEGSDKLFNRYYVNAKNEKVVTSIIDQSTKHVIIVAGFGGGIGTSGTKWLINLYEKFNLDVTVVCTIPFDFEGERKQRRALDAVKILEENGIAIKIIFAEDLSKKHEDLNLYNCFSYLDEHVAEAVTEISNRLEEKAELFEPN